MYYSMVYGAYGDPDYHIKDMRVESTASGLSVSIYPAANLGDTYYQVYVNNVFAAVIYCPEGRYSETVTVPAPVASEYQVTAFRIGSNSTIDMSDFARIYDVGSSFVTANWSWDYEIIGTADSDFFSSWSLTGITVSRVLPGSKPTRGNIPVSMTVSGGTATITLGNLAQGSGAVGGSVTLSAINSSGVSGSVTVDALATTESSTLSVRWPRSMSILRDTVSPPTTEVASVPYNNLDTASYVDSVSPDTYYYAFRAVSDTDDVGDASSPETVVVSGAPEPPTDIAYSSGNAAATVIGWTVSDTVGATYNVYFQNIDDPYMDTGAATQTEIAGSTSTTLPAVTGYPGIARVIIRSESAGIEEKNIETVTLEYDASGNIVSARPNIPEIEGVAVSSGLTIAVTAIYDATGEDASPATVELFTRTAAGSYNFLSPDNSAALGSRVNGDTVANLSHTLLASGWHYCTTKAKTSGGQYCAGYSPEVAFYVSDNNAVAPTGTFTATRG